MKKLKILFNTSPGAFGSWGGGEIQLLETKKALEKLGHKVKILEQENYNVDWEGFDIFHNFNIHRDNLEFVLQAKKQGLPVAVSTIYWPSLRSILRWNRGIKVKTKNVTAEIVRRVNIAKVNKAFGIVKNADILLPNSKAEATVLQKQFSIVPEKIHVVPNGVEERFAKANPKEFEKKFHIKDFVLYVGRVEERKNVLALVKAMEGIPTMLVVVGKAKQGSECYLRKCKEAAGKNVKFLEPIPHDSKLLESCYAASKVFCLPSWYETPGLAALEAGLAGANIAVTNEGCTQEYFQGFASYCNPASAEDIREKILLEWEKPKSNQLREHLLHNFLWENAAKETEKAYEKILVK